ncbi:ABC transporter ATP-binding protein [Dermatophilus congolensis]|uniref:ABC transporter ATP-binding protein n=1 Tax=Dermatophilus congolensis TaxID=1863 RepID=UPI00312C76A8
MSRPAVLVQHLVKQFGTTTAVADATWSANPGAITTVLGPNGSGKTTTMECLEGLQSPTSGTVRVLGADPLTVNPEHRARVGVMLQDGGLPNTVTSGRLLRHLAHLYRNPIPPSELADRLDLTSFEKTTVRRLSGGQRRRLALAAAIIGRPHVLFLDEPAAGLDPHARLDVWDLVTELRNAGVCVIITTHSFEEAERLADHVVVMNEGTVVADGTVQHIAGNDTLENAFFNLTPRQRRSFTSQQWINDPTTTEDSA